MAIPAIRTNEFLIGKDYDLRLRSIYPTNRAVVASGTDSNGNPRGTLSTDIVVWKVTLKFTGIPSNAWISSDVPPRYRLGMYRLYYRDALVESGFITDPIVDIGSFVYAYDVPYQTPTFYTGVFPPDDDFPGYGSAIDTARLNADRIVINQSLLNVQCNVILHTYYNPLVWSYFF